MILVYPSAHIRHCPPNEIFNGNRDSHAEVPDRLEVIRGALGNMPGVRSIAPRRFPMSWIGAVHERAYIRYLKASSSRAGSAYVYPSVFPYGQDQHTLQPIGMRGQYSFDMYTPVSESTYEAARGSAMAALTAASLVMAGETQAYALCRPPGHHAEYAKMGGYCYFNNAAIAANYLSTRGTVAVIDIDVHHGNGTQALLYHRRDVLMISIHGDPDTLFPYFSGRASEIGVGNGVGYNLNIPLPARTKDRAYGNALRAAIARIRAFSPSYLVVSVGYDAHVSDPIGGFALSTPMFHRIGKELSSLGIATVYLQEGGYNIKTLGSIARAFTEGSVLTD